MSPTGEVLIAGMTRRQYLAVTFGQYALWYACVGGAPRGYPWQGAALVALWCVGAVVVSTDKVAMTGRIVGSLVLGYAVDSAIVLGGWMTFSEGVGPQFPTTVWMLALWALAATLLHAFPVVKGKWLAAGAVAGGLFAPLAYYAGEEVGAADVVGWSGAIAIGVLWAVASVPLLMLGNWRRDGEPEFAVPTMRPKRRR